jgi:hypothetical protein
MHVFASTARNLGLHGTFETAHNQALHLLFGVKARLDFLVCYVAKTWVERPMPHFALPSSLPVAIRLGSHRNGMVHEERHHVPRASRGKGFSSGSMERKAAAADIAPARIGANS